MKTQVSLVIFTTEGREYLLEKTYHSFLNSCDFKFNQVIMAIDGIVDQKIIKIVNPTKLVQNYKRTGYISSIVNALKMIDNQFFLWLEDDWLFSSKIDIHTLVNLLKNNSEWLQIRLSKTAPLMEQEKKLELCKGIFESIDGFSANPCICRTEYIEKGFKALQNSQLDERISFENFFSQWCNAQSIVCTVLDPGEAPMVIHSGYLESTPRQWHMTASLDGKVETYLSGMGNTDSPPPFWRKCLMLFKLILVSIKIAILQFWNLSFYDLAFRIVNIKQY
ncbi:MAG: hypothetical protein AAFQ91_02020 [Cyanobacteria bacterium J06621_15]